MSKKTNKQPSAENFKNEKSNPGITQEIPNYSPQSQTKKQETTNCDHKNAKN